MPRTGPHFAGQSAPMLPEQTDSNTPRKDLPVAMPHVRLSSRRGKKGLCHDILQTGARVHTVTFTHSFVAMRTWLLLTLKQVLALHSSYLASSGGEGSHQINQIPPQRPEFPGQAGRGKGNPASSVHEISLLPPGFCLTAASVKGRMQPIGCGIALDQ